MIPESRRGWRALLLGFLGVVLVWATFVAVSLWLARADAEAGRRALDRARGLADPTAVDDERLAAELGRAEREFGRARDRLLNPILSPVRILPVAGRQVRSFTALASAAEDASAVAARVVLDARNLAARPLDGPRARVDLARDIAEITGEAARRLANISLGPSKGLVRPLARARDEFGDELADLTELTEDARDVADALAGLLEGPRRYLVFGANNAEMRAGSGMWLFAGELTAQDGRLALTEFQSTGDLVVPPGAVPLEGDMAELWGWALPNEDWRNLMLSPHFPASAELAAAMWASTGRAPVDGVMVLDPVGLREIMRVTGPVSVNGDRYTAKNVVAEILHDQYLRFSGPRERADRLDQLGRLAQAVFGDLDRGEWAASDLVSGLARAARGRHLLMWSARAGEQGAWEATAAGGTVSRDALVVSVLNRGANKLDPFLRVEGQLAIDEGDDATALTVRLTFENTTPEGEPEYVAGPHPSLDGLEAGDYRGIVALTLPGYARRPRFEDVEYLAVGGTDGANTVIGFEIDVPRGQTREVVARFAVPEEVHAIRIEPSARRPPVAWTSGRSSWKDEEARTVEW